MKVCAGSFPEMEHVSQLVMWGIVVVTALYSVATVSLSGFISFASAAVLGFFSCITTSMTLSILYNPHLIIGRVCC